MQSSHLTFFNDHFRKWNCQICDYKFRNVAFGLFVFLMVPVGSTETCRNVLSAEEKITPARIEYFESGRKRILEESGLIYEFDGSNWHRIGSGQFLNGVVYQKVELRAQPSTTESPKILGQELQLAGTKAPFRNSPISKIIEFPSNKRSFSSNIHKLEVGERSIEIVIPENFGLERVLEGVTQAVLNLPFVHLELLKFIRVNPYESLDFQEKIYGATTDNRPTIDLFPLSLDMFSNNQPFAVRILRHEFGHLIASKIFGQSTPNHDYISIAQKDKFTVSEYGRTNWAEDFAEAVETYLRLNAGKIDPIVRQQLKNRFEFLDKVFGTRSPGSIELPKPTVKLLRNRQHIIISALSTHQLLILVPEAGRGLIFSLD